VEVNMDEFRAWMLRETDRGPALTLEKVPVEDLPSGDVLVEVHWSTVNYKDALAVTGRGKVVRRYPLVPGIDLAGVVLESSSPEFGPGDEVLVNGWEIGELHWGGYAELARVKAVWPVRVPATIGLRGAMAVGTAGFTAALAVLALEAAGVDREAEEPVLVTGASGGLGSIAVTLLAAAGYRVAALTGRPENADYLHRLGAAEIVPRNDLQRPGRPLESQRWAGAVDAVGGEILARILAETRYGGTVASCGLTGGSRLDTTVMPFILRAVNLLGINSTLCPAYRRRAAWDLIARDLSPELLEQMTREVGMDDVPRAAQEVLAGSVKGRLVVDVRR
jgi:acrylyl-CoA reductase (NADPH)